MFEAFELRYLLVGEEEEMPHLVSMETMHNQLRIYCLVELKLAV